MRVQRGARRGCLFAALTVMFAALIASPGRAQPKFGGPVAPGPILSGSLSVFFGGPGGGGVAGTYLRFISFGCDSDCTKTLGRTGWPITLRATPDSDSVFAGWGGACSGAGVTCTLTLSSSTRVIAYFRPNHRIVSAGAYHTCDLRPLAGDMMCWGRHGDGQLGNGNDTLTVGAPLGIMNAVAIAAGGFHTCALIAGGKVQCWGNNQEGQLGAFTFGIDSGTPLPVPDISDAVALTAGGYHTCVVRAGGTASCWGLDRDGELGDGGSLDHSYAPVAVDLSHVGALTKQIAAGGFHTCAIVAADSTVACWGENNVGQLGLGFHSDAERTPFGKVQIQPPPCTGGFNVGCASGTTFLKATMLAASMGVGQINLGQYGGFHTVALDAAGQDWGWGSNSELELNPTIGGEQDYAVHGFTPTPGTIVQLAAGAFHTCIASLAQGVFCRGANNQGQAGGPTSSTNAPPVSVASTLGALGVTAGVGHTCAVVGQFFGVSPTPDGVVVCWGDNSFGQVNGVANPGASVTVPVILTFP